MQYIANLYVLTAMGICISNFIILYFFAFFNSFYSKITHVFSNVFSTFYMIVISLL